MGASQSWPTELNGVQASLLAFSGPDDAHSSLPIERVGGVNVLLVENDASVRGCIAEMLEEAGLRVAEASNATEALAWMHASTPPPVLVADLCLGHGMDGVALIAALRDRTPALCAILISAGEVAEDKLDRCDAFLPKPFHGDDLVRAIKAAGGETPWPC